VGFDLYREQGEYTGLCSRFLGLELGSLKQVRKAADEVNSYKEPIDHLINNAGVMGLSYQ
jgi:short-subunit dehydrogenase